MKRFSNFFALLLFIVPLFALAQTTMFPLPADNFIKAKMPMHLVYPRPDSETQAHSRHRWAHPGMEYQIPIGVQGGAWPFKYEITQGPVGAHIGSLHGEDNYGVITWSPAMSSGVAEFKVKVTDQELNVVEAIWRVNVDPSMFIFIKAGASGNKSGTITEPLSSFDDWYKASQTDATYRNKIAVFRGGRYQVMGAEADNYNVRLTEGAKTPSLIGFPGEAPIFDCSRTKFFTDSNKLHDLFVAGITWDNARQDIANAHYWWAVGDITRATWWRNTFQNIGPGQVGTDNTGPVFIATSTMTKENILYKENAHINVQNMGFNGTYFTLYKTKYTLIEQNTAKNSKTGIGLHAKGTVAFITIRANNLSENVDGTQIGVGYGAEAGNEPPSDHEVCWNYVKLTAGSSSTSFIWSNSNYYAGRTYNSYIYRNTFENGSAWVRFPGRELFKVDANVVITNNVRRWEPASMTVQKDNVVDGINSGLLTTGKVEGLLYGKVGADVAVKPAPAAPINPKINN